MFCRNENSGYECAIEDVQPEKYEPTLGILFDSYEEMQAFYKAYSKQKGFPMKNLINKKGVT